MVEEQSDHRAPAPQAPSSRRAEDSAATAAADWAEIADVLDTAVVTTDATGRVARANRAFARLVGRAAADLPGADLAELLLGPAPPGAAPGVLPDAMYRRAATTVRLGALDGWYAVRGYPVWRRGAIRGWIHTLEGGARLHRAAEQRHRLAQAAAQAHDGIAVLDAAARLDYANDELRRMFALGDGDGDGLRVGAPLPATGALAAVAAGLERARREGAVTLRERGAAADGTQRSLELGVRRILGEDGALAGYAVIARDLTERERLLQIAEHASAMDSVSHWLGGLRHELGNPVTAVKLALTVLRSHVGELSADEVARSIDSAAAELVRVEHLLRALKTLSPHAPLERAPVPLEPFLASARRLFEPDLHRRGAALELHVTARPVALADPRALHQVLVNLVSNAADALAPEGGKIRVEARALERRVELCVRDDGCGMSAAQLARLFRPLETTKPGGTGLGLVLVQRLAAAMGGTVAVASEPGRGTAVTVTLEAAP